MSDARDQGRDVVVVSRSHLMARLVTLAAGFLFVASLMAGSNPHLWAVAGMLVAVMLATWQPHTLMPLITMGYLLANWIAWVPTASSLTLSPWTLLGALGLLIFHTGAACCAAMPAQAPLPKAWWRLNGQRVGVVSAATTGLWLLAGAVSGAELGGGLVPALMAVGVVAVALIVHYRIITQRDDTPLRS